MLAGNDLREPEKRLVAAIGTGELVDLSTGKPARDDPATGAKWPARRTVRAELVAELLTSVREPESGQPRALRLRGARVEGALALEAATLACPVTFEACHFADPIDLTEARVSSLRLPGCHLAGIHADQLHAQGGVGLAGVVVPHGHVLLRGARIGGDLDLTGAQLRGPDGTAFHGDGLHVDQRLHFGDGFVAEGEVGLVGAHIGSQLVFRGAVLSNPNRCALAADGLTVGLNLYCEPGFSAQGEVRLVGARIGGQVGFRAAQLSTPNGYALVGDGLSADQGMYCHDGFTARGEVRLIGAHIGTDLAFDGAHLSSPGKRTLDLQDVRAKSLWLRFAARPDGVVNLNGADVGVLLDERATWPSAIGLRGFGYGSFGDDAVDVRGRLEWLSRNTGGYAPGLYDQLAAVYRRSGHTDAARRVAITKHWRRRFDVNLFGQLWNYLLYLTVGYGYRPWLAAVWLAGLLTAGSAIFAAAYPAHLTASSATSPTFHPVAYTLDVLLPIVDLGQERSWIPDASVQGWAWLLTLAGWILTTAVVAGVTNALRRE